MDLLRHCRPALLLGALIAGGQFGAAHAQRAMIWPILPYLQETCAEVKDLEPALKVEQGQGIRARFRTTLPKKNETLLLGDALPKETGKSFLVFETQLKKRQEFLEFVCVPPSGKPRTQYYVIEAERETWNEALAAFKSHKRLGFNFSLMLGSMSYRQGSTIALSQLNTVAKAAYFRPLSDRWDVSGNAYVTLLPFSMDFEGKMRVLGVNARAGYEPGWLPKPWSLKFGMGLYYQTLFGELNNQSFGYRNIAGPQVFPILSREFNGDSAFVYGKFSPVSDRLGFLSLSNYELAGGGGYAHSLRSGRQITASLDLSHLQLTMGREEISIESFSVGLGYGL